MKKLKNNLRLIIIILLGCLVGTMIVLVQKGYADEITDLTTRSSQLRVQVIQIRAQGGLLDRQLIDFIDRNSADRATVELNIEALIKQIQDLDKQIKALEMPVAKD